MAAISPLLRGQAKPFEFGFSLYGMRTIPVREGLAHCARIGYKTIELCLRPGWPTESKLVTKADRVDLRKRIADLGLSMPSVMENIALARPGGSLQANLERLRAAAEICHEVSPGAPALIETTVGGRPTAWEENRKAMAEELGAWAKTAERLKTKVAIKAHSKNAMNVPERALWMVDQVKSPWIGLVYDYSHYQVNRLDMRKTMEQVASRAIFVHIKDSQGPPENFKFILPGDGRIDYRIYARNLAEVGYRGPVVVEVSVDVFGLPGYDPVAAAKRVWDRVSPAFV
jgi:sugar phosphate isomerase/epimerase